MIDSSAIILYCPSDSLISPACEENHFLVGLRSRKQAVFSNQIAFVGGKTESLDLSLGSRIFSSSHLSYLRQYDLEQGSKDSSLNSYFTPIEDALITGIREFFEETGICLLPHKTDSLSLNVLKQIRGKSNFFTSFLSSDLFIPLSSHNFQVLYGGLWISPILKGERFRTHFFLVKLPPHLCVCPSLSSSSSQLFSESNKRSNTVCFSQLLSPDLYEWEDIWWTTARKLLLQFQSMKYRIPPPVLQVVKMFYSLSPEQISSSLVKRSFLPSGLRVPLEYQSGIESLPFRSVTLPPATHTNLVAFGDRELILVDPGAAFKKGRERLSQVIKYWKSEGRIISAVLLSHHHLDHLSSIDIIQDDFGIPVLAHPLTKMQLKDLGVQLDGTIKDNQTISLGKDPLTEEPWNLRVFATPGHDLGHVIVVDERYRHAAVGDMIAGTGSIMVSHPDGNMKDYFKSLELMQSLNLKSLFPGHGPFILNGQKKIKEYIVHRRDRENKIIQALTGSAGMDTAALYTQVYQNVPLTLKKFAENTMIMHLEKLISEERAKQIGNRWMLTNE